MKFELSAQDYRNICETLLHNNYRYKEAEIEDQNFYDEVLENEIDNWFCSGMNPTSIDDYILYELEYYTYDEFIYNNIEEFKEYIEDQEISDEEFDYMLEIGDYSIVWDKIEEMADYYCFDIYDRYGYIVVR